jgi:hypothetical protein
LSCSANPIRIRFVFAPPVVGTAASVRVGAPPEFLHFCGQQSLLARGRRLSRGRPKGTITDWGPAPEARTVPRRRLRSGSRRVAPAARSRRRRGRAGSGWRSCRSGKAHR